MDLHGDGIIFSHNDLHKDTVYIFVFQNNFLHVN